MELVDTLQRKQRVPRLMAHLEKLVAPGQYDEAQAALKSGGEECPVAGPQ